jgi:predicted nucleic acid-binding protein
MLDSADERVDEYLLGLMHAAVLASDQRLDDLWIAALAIEHDLPVLSRDAHFDVVEGLTRISW